MWNVPHEAKPLRRPRSVAAFSLGGPRRSRSVGAGNAGCGLGTPGRPCRGRVTGEPAAGIPVLLQCSWLDGRWGRLPGTTDANGQFTIATPPGQCTLAINVPPGLSAIGPGLRLYEFAPGETVEAVGRLERYAPRSQSRAGCSTIAETCRRPESHPSVERHPRGDAAMDHAAFARRDRRHRSVPVRVGRPGTWEIIVPALGMSRLVEIARRRSGGCAPRADRDSRNASARVPRVGPGRDAARQGSKLCQYLSGSRRLAAEQSADDRGNRGR